MVEVNEKWSCPSARTVTAMARAGVSLVAGSDSHHCRDVGVYRSVRLTVGAGGRA
jgi:putative hydrolase